MSFFLSALAPLFSIQRASFNPSGIFFVTFCAITWNNYKFIFSFFRFNLFGGYLIVGSVAQSVAHILLRCNINLQHFVLLCNIGAETSCLAKRSVRYIEVLDLLFSMDT